jgi:hypothetical protein
MPRLKLTKSAIDALPAHAKDIVYWDSGCPGFGVKVTPKGRKVFIVLYRAGGAGSRLRKYTIGPYETTGSVRDSSCCSATRQRCCVANSNDVTVLDATPVVAIVKITSAHMLCPFVVASLHGRGSPLKL